MYGSNKTLHVVTLHCSLTHYKRTLNYALCTPVAKLKWPLTWGIWHTTCSPLVCAFSDQTDRDEQFDVWCYYLGRLSAAPIPFSRVYECAHEWRRRERLVVCMYICILKCSRPYLLLILIQYNSLDVLTQFTSDCNNIKQRTKLRSRDSYTCA